MKTWKIALFAALCILLVGAGILIGRGAQGQAEPQEVTFTLLIKAPGSFTLDMTPKNTATGEPEIDAVRGTNAIFTITSTAVDGYDAQIEYTVAGLPEGTYTFSQNPAPVGTPVTLTINTSSLASNTAYVCTLTGSPK